MSLVGSNYSAVDVVFQGYSLHMIKNIRVKLYFENNVVVKRKNCHEFYIYFKRKGMAFFQELASTAILASQ